MEVSLKDIHSRFGDNKAILISFENREEFNELIDMLNSVQEDNTKFYQLIEEKIGKSYDSYFDVFLEKLKRSYREVPSYRDITKMSYSCMLFSNDFPELFLAFFDCLMLYDFTSYYFKKFNIFSEDKKKPLEDKKESLEDNLDNKENKDEQ